MQQFLFILGGIVVGSIVVFLLLRRKPSESGQGSDGLVLLQNQFNEMGRHLQDLTKTLDNKIGESSRFMHQSLQSQFGESQTLIKSITEELTRVTEGQKQVAGFADQLRDLQDILKNPKQRGILGEYYLETLLKNVLPTGSYQMQYPFSDGTIVDAVVFVKDKIIPIDSKFSLENYNRLVEETDPLEKERLEKAFRNDLKNRIDETSKYVKPNENTMDFAFMFIPHEAIYYDLLISQVGAVKVNTRDLVEYAFKDRHVIIVSPTSFLAYLQTVLQGLKALQIEESAKHIKANVENLQKHLGAFEEYHSKLGNALGTAVNQYNNSTKEFKKVDKDMLRITGDSTFDDLPLIEKPDSDLD
jgi:DNA recombination protein RmuC